MDETQLSARKVTEASSASGGARLHGDTGVVDHGLLDDEIGADRCLGRSEHVSCRARGVQAPLGPERGLGIGRTRPALHGGRRTLYVLRNFMLTYWCNSDVLPTL